MDFIAADRNRFSRHCHCKDDKSRLKSLIFIVFFICCGQHSSVLVVSRAYKEESVGHRDSPALFKNIGVKLVSRTGEGDGEGEGEKQRTSAVGSSYYHCRNFMQISVQMFILSM